MKKTTKKDSTPKAQLDYKITVQILGKKYEAVGSDVHDALLNLLKLKINNCKSKAVFTVSKGDVSKERVIMPVVVYRLFNSSGLSREIALKQASILFNGI